jgi:transposase
MPKHLSTEEKGVIVGMNLAGMKHREIAEARGVPKSTVSGIISNYGIRGTTTHAQGAGRPPALTERDIRSVARSARRDRRATLREIASILPHQVSERTVQRALHAAGIFSRIATKKPYLDERHRQRRIDFERAYRNWTLEQWSKIVWTDESSFEVGDNFRQIRVWRTAEEKYDYDYNIPIFKSGRTTLMVRGAFTATRKSRLVVFERGRRDAKSFVEDVYEGELTRFMTEVQDGILMEDGAPVHSSAVASKWRQNHQIQKIEDWPANSPDLNSMEHIWSLLGDALNRRPRQPHDIPTLVVALVEEWNALPQETLTMLVNTMPHRLKEVRERHGRNTHY